MNSSSKNLHVNINFLNNPGKLKEFGYNFIVE
jgi:hypothetical protein